MALSMGCYRAHRLPGDAGSAEAGRADAGRIDGSSEDAGRARDADTPPPETRDLDLLFVVDNSISMVEEQASLTAELPRLLAILASGDFDQDGDGAGDGEAPDEDFVPPRALHVAVITTDMGAAGNRVPTCTPARSGDDGLFRDRSTGRDGCMTVYPSFLRFDPARDDPATLAATLSCVAAAGTDGCGVEQPLEATLKALSPAAPTRWTHPGYEAPRFFEGSSGHGDGANDAFIHPGGVLAILLLTDDDDCSAALPALFDPRAEEYTPVFNLRCSLHEEALHPVSRYVDGLLQLRRDPRRLVFVPVAGVPVDLVTSADGTPWDRIEADPRLVARVDPDMRTELVPSCNVPGRGVAYPPRRLLRVARELEEGGAGVRLLSICNEGYREALGVILERL